MKNPLGLSDTDVGRLTSHAQEHFGPEDFSAEVQKFLDLSPAEKGADSFSDSQKQEAESESIANQADFGNPPVIPAPVKKSALPAKSAPFEELGS